MWKSQSHLMILLVVTLFAIALAPGQETKIYPGAKFDADSSRQASSAKTHSQVYLSDDGFEKVYAYYKALYRETPFSPPAPVLKSGKEVRWAFFIVDDGKDLAHSKHWIKIQRPFILTVGETQDFQGVRDVSVIQAVQR